MATHNEKEDKQPPATPDAVEGSLVELIRDDEADRIEFEPVRPPAAPLREPW